MILTNTQNSDVYHSNYNSNYNNMSASYFLNSAPSILFEQQTNNINTSNASLGGNTNNIKNNIALTENNNTNNSPNSNNNSGNSERSSNNNINNDGLYSNFNKYNNQLQQSSNQQNTLNIISPSLLSYSPPSPPIPNFNNSSPVALVPQPLNSFSPFTLSIANNNNNNNNNSGNNNSSNNNSTDNGGNDYSSINNQMGSSLEDHNKSGFMKFNNVNPNQLQQNHFQIQQIAQNQPNLHLQNHFQAYYPLQYINSPIIPPNGPMITGGSRSNLVTSNSIEPTNQYYYNVYLGIYNQINNLCQKVNVQEEKLLFLQSIAKQNDDKFKEIESQLVKLSENIIDEDKFKSLGIPSPPPTNNKNNNTINNKNNNSSIGNGSTSNQPPSLNNINNNNIGTSVTSSSSAILLPSSQSINSLQSSSVSPVLPSLPLPLPLVHISPHQQPHAQLILSPQQKILSSPQLSHQQLQHNL